MSPTGVPKPWGRGRRLSSPRSPLLEEIGAAVTDSTARGIAAGISRLVSSGRLEAGVRLPTVRALADQLGVSPTTVSQAWQSLTRVGVVMPRGRSGTFVRGGRVVGAGRTMRTYETPGGLPLDLSTGTPDPALLPNLARALAKVSGSAVTTSYVDRPVHRALEELTLASWPFEPERLTVVNGAMDALDRVTTALVRLGSRVIVENPCFPPLLDLLDLVGADVIGVPVDDEGPIPEAVAEALRLEPLAFYLQPRAHNPAGHSLSVRRARSLSTLLAKSSITVIEDDHAGDISLSPLVSIGSYLPGQTVHIRSFSKTYGPDLRVAAMGGAAALVEAVDARRLLGPAWTSRLLQAVLAELLVDPESIAQVARAKEVYGERRRYLGALLAERQVCAVGRDGINQWIEVPHEQSALVTLAAAGVGASPGSSFEAFPLAVDHVRVTVGLVETAQAERVADALGAAIKAGAARSSFPTR